MKWTLSKARRVVGSIGAPSKMPGTSYGLPAKACIAGARLAKIPGSICNECYALHGKASYQMPRAHLGQQRRLISITDPLWVDAMVFLLLRLHSKPAIKIDLGAVGVRRQKLGGSRYQLNETGYHRWHDSGDLQSVEHFEKIVEVCHRTPRIRHWLPTRETVMVRQFKGKVPDNLVIRVSATMIDGLTPIGWECTSTVHRTSAPSSAHECPAPKQEHRCGSCRACWSRDVQQVSYLAH